MVVGVAMTLVCLVLGFYFLMTDQDHWAKRLLPFIPIGFLITFTGLVATLFSAPRQDGRR
jgi:hypothetical protein